MMKKDLGLFLLIVVVGCVVAFMNPRFLSPINLGNTANLTQILTRVATFDATDLDHCPDHPPVPSPRQSGSTAM